MKRVGFVIEGVSNLKVFGSLIKEAVKFDILPIAIISKGGGGKNYDVITPEILCRTFPNVMPENVHYYEDSSILEIARNNGIKSLIFTNAYRKYSKYLSDLRIAGVKTYDVDYFINPVYAAAWKGHEKDVELTLENITERFVTSDYFKELELKIAPQNRIFRQKFIPTGTPMADVYRYIDSQKAREILRIPADKKIICLLTPNIRQKHSFFFYGFRTASKIKKIINNLKKFCQEKGYLLAIKTRRKQWGFNMYQKLGDYLVDDLAEAVFPHTSALLLSSCELMVHFGSIAVFEAAAANTPSLGIEVSSIDKLHHYMLPEARKIIKEEIFSDKANSMFNFQNVSRSVSVNNSYREIKNICEELVEDKKNLNQYVEYNKKFTGKTEEYGPTEKILKRISENY